MAFANEKGTTRKKPFDARRIERSRGRGGTPRRGGSERRDALFVYVFACGVASRSRGRRGCARGVSRTSPRGPRSHREADPFGHGISVPLAPSPRAEVTRTRGPRPRRPPKPHARHPPAADGTDGQPPQPPSSRVVSSAPASDSAPPVKNEEKKFRPWRSRGIRVERRRPFIKRQRTPRFSNEEGRLASHSACPPARAPGLSSRDTGVAPRRDALLVRHLGRRGGWSRTL